MARGASGSDFFRISAARYAPYGKGGAPAMPLPINFGSGEEGSNLYVRGLPPTADDLYLYKVVLPDFSNIWATGKRKDNT